MFKLTFLFICCLGIFALLFQADAFRSNTVFRVKQQQLQSQQWDNKALFVQPQRLVSSALMAANFHAPEGVDAKLEYPSVSLYYLSILITLCSFLILFITGVCVWQRSKSFQLC